MSFFFSVEADAVSGHALFHLVLPNTVPVGLIEHKSNHKATFDFQQHFRWSECVLMNVTFEYSHVPKPSAVLHKYCMKCNVNTNN